MKKGFTMIELIFVIVILGILAAVAIPKLAATRDDAKAASIKTDIGTIMQAVPAWYQGQKEASFEKALSLDTNVWEDDDANSTCSYTYTDSAGDTIAISIIAADYNATNDTTTNKATSINCDEDNATLLGNAPYLNIALTSTSGADIVGTLVTQMGVSADTNITLAGKKVKW